MKNLMWMAVLMASVMSVWAGSTRIVGVNDSYGRDDYSRKVRELTVRVASGFAHVSLEVNVLVKSKAGDYYYGTKTEDYTWPQTPPAQCGYKFNVVIDGIEGASIEAYEIILKCSAVKGAPFVEDKLQKKVKGQNLSDWMKLNINKTIVMPVESKGVQ